MAKLDTLQKVEISEGVEIQLRLAGPVVRASALLLDYLIKIGITLAVYLVALMLGMGLAGWTGSKVGFGVATGVIGLFAFVLDWIYMIGFEVSAWNATPGKRMMGLRVARTSGAPISLQQAVVRNMLRVVDMLPIGGGFGLMSCMMTRRFQRLGDLAADTVVVYAEAPKGAEDRGETLVEGGLVVRPAVRMTREEQRAVVTFAERNEGWSEARRQELANHARPLHEAKDGEAVERLLGVARWIRSSS